MDRPASLPSEEPSEADLAPAVQEAIMRVTPDRNARQLLFFVFTEHLLKHPSDFEFLSPAEYETVAKEHMDYLLAHRPQQFKPPMTRTFRSYLLAIYRTFPPRSPAPSPHDSPTSSSGKKERRHSTSPTPGKRGFPRKHAEIAADHEHLWAFLRCIVEASTKSSVMCVCGKLQQVDLGYNYYTHIRDKCTRGKEPPFFVAPAEAEHRQVRSRPSVEELRVLAGMSEDMMNDLQSAIRDALRSAAAELAASATETPSPHAEPPPLVAPIGPMPLNDQLIDQDVNFPLDEAERTLK